MSDTSEKLALYTALGIDLSRENSKEHKGECPFCEGSSLHINVEKELFHCKTCDASGNKYTFLQLYYDLCFDATRIAQRHKLEKLRDLPRNSTNDADIAYDLRNRQWLFPFRNNQDSMTNLGRWSLPPKTQKTTRLEKASLVKGLPGLKLNLFNRRAIEDNGTLFICEGPWDWLALDWLLASQKDVGVIAVPGASTFPENWSQDFAHKKIILAYDNDAAGQKGVEKVAKLLENQPGITLEKIAWPESFPDKFDVKDLISRLHRTPLLAIRNLTKYRTPLESFSPRKASPEKSDLKRTRFSQISKDFSNHIHFSDDLQEALLIIFSIIVSNKIFKSPFCPLWMFLVGPSGSGKTLLLQTVSDLEEVSFQTTLTPKTLVSGFKTTDGSDPSLLPRIIGKTLILEDYTGIMDLPSGDQDEIYGVFRSAYNGRYEKPFGHIGTRIYPDPNSEHETCHFTYIAGTTGAIHADRRANHGERFLKYHMQTGDYDPIPKIRRSVRNTLESTPPEILLRPYVTAFLQHKMENIPEENASLSLDFETKIIGLGQIISMIRAVVLRKQGELVIRPEAEIGSRISQQLVKMAQAVSFVLDKKTIDRRTYNLILRVGLDTCYGWHRDVLMTVADQTAHKKKGISRETISEKAYMSSSTAHRCLEDLFELGALEFEQKESTSKGRPARLWRLTPTMASLFKLAEIKPSQHLIQPVIAVPSKNGSQAVDASNGKPKPPTTRRKKPIKRKRPIKKKNTP